MGLFTWLRSPARPKRVRLEGGDLFIDLTDRLYVASVTDGYVVWAADVTPDEHTLFGAGLVHLKADKMPPRSTITIERREEK